MRQALTELIQGDRNWAPKPKLKKKTNDPMHAPNAKLTLLQKSANCVETAPINPKVSKYT